MNKTTKIILSAIGVSAIVVPAILLIVFTSRVRKEPSVSSGSRQIDSSTIKDVVKKVPQPEVKYPSPTPASSSARPVLEGSPSSR